MASITGARQQTRTGQESRASKVSGQPTVPSTIQAFDDLARLTRDTTDIKAVAKSVADKFKALVDVDRCAIFLRTENPGQFRVSTWLGRADFTAHLRGMVNGPDPYTTEILARREPVVIADSRTDPRVAENLDTTLKCNVRSMIGIPITFDDEVTALAFLDNEGVPTHFTISQLNTATQFATLCGVAMGQLRELDQARQQLVRLQQQNSFNRRLYLASERLDQLVYRDAAVSDFAQVTASAVNRPVAIYDANWRKIAEAQPPGALERRLGELSDVRLRAHPKVEAVINRVTTGETCVVPPLPVFGLDLRCLMAPIPLGAANWGHIVIHETGRPFDAFDSQIATNAGSRLAISLSSVHLGSATRGELRGAFLDDLLNGKLSAASVARRAEGAGVGVGPYVICVFGGIGRGQVPQGARELLDEIQATRGSGGVLSTECDGRLVCLIPTTPDPDVKSTAVETLRQMVGAAAIDDTDLRNLVVGVSTQFTELSAGAKAYREAGLVLRAMQRFENPRLPRVVAANEIGAGLTFLSSANVTEARAFAHEQLGALISTDEHAQLVITLRTFLRTGNVIQCSRALHVHENTVRYRLSKVESLTGLSILSETDSQIRAALAILVLRFTGECDWQDEDIAGT